jgi:hypothetical protein
MRGVPLPYRWRHTAADLGRLRSTVAQRWSAFVSRWFPVSLEGEEARGGDNPVTAGKGGKMYVKKIFATFCVAHVTSTCIIVAHAGGR